VVGENAKLSGLNHVPRVLHCPVDRQELAVERAVLAFSGAKFGREKLERLPGAIDVLLQHGTDGIVRGVSEDGEGGVGRRPFTV
jgi:hypothetical protein